MNDLATDTKETSTPARASRPKAKPGKKHAQTKKVVAPTARELLAEKLIAVERSKILARLSELDDALVTQLLSIAA